MAKSSSRVGGGVSSSLSATRSVQPVFARTSSTPTPGCTDARNASPSLPNRSTPKVVISADGARSQREALRRAPAVAPSVSGRCDVPNTLAESRALVREQDDGALRQTCYVARAARARQTLHFAVTIAPRGIQIAEAIDFGRAEKTELHAALLQKGHYVEHLAALSCAANIRWVGHGVKQFRRGSFANQAILVETDGARRMSPLRDEKCEHWQPHADEDEFAIGDFSRRGGDHDFARGVSARCYLAFAIRCGHRFLYRRATTARCAIPFCFLIEVLSGSLLLFSVKMRAPLFEKCGQSFGAVFGIEALDLALDFFIEKLLEFRAIGAEQSILHKARGDRRATGERCSCRVRFGHELLEWHYAIINPKAQTFLGGNHFARIKEFRGARGADQARQKKRAAKIGIQAELGETLAEASLFCGDAQITCEREIRTAAGRGPIHGSENGLRHGGQEQNDFFSGTDQGGQLVRRTALARITQNADISAAAKCAPCASENYTAHRMVFARASKRSSECGAKLDIERVQSIGAIQSNGENRARALFQNHASICRTRRFRHDSSPSQQEN